MKGSDGSSMSDKIYYVNSLIRNTFMPTGFLTDDSLTTHAGRLPRVKANAHRVRPISASKIVGSQL